MQKKPRGRKAEGDEECERVREGKKIRETRTDKLRKRCDDWVVGKGSNGGGRGRTAANDSSGCNLGR